MKILAIVSVLFSVGFTSLCGSESQKPAEKGFLAKTKEFFTPKKEAPVVKEIRPMTAEEVAALTPKPKEPSRLGKFGQEVGASVVEHVVDKIIPGYKADLAAISKVSDLLAESAQSLKKKSVELAKAFPEPNLKELERLLPAMFNDFKQFAGVNIMLAQIEVMLRKVRNSLKDNAEAVRAIDETIVAIDKTKEGLNYVWDLPNAIAHTFREVAKQIELMFAPVENRSTSSTYTTEPAG